MSKFTDELWVSLDLPMGADRNDWNRLVRPLVERLEVKASLLDTLMKMYEERITPLLIEDIYQQWKMLTPPGPQSSPESSGPAPASTDSPSP